MLAYINIGMLAMLIYQLLNNVDRELTAISLKEQDGEVKATFRLPIELMKKLKYMAIDNNTSVNALVVKALTDLINPHNRSNLNTSQLDYVENKFVTKVAKEVGENITKSRRKK